MAEKAPPRPGIDAFHKERSKCVDAFASLEAAVISLLTSADISPKADSFGQKLASLAKAKPSPQLSKAAIDKLPDILARCDEIRELRNDIIHARLKLAVICDVHMACFINLRDDLKDCQNARLLTLEGMRALAARILHLTAELEGIRR